MARKILLADDSVTAQNMGRKILADAGYEVITVNNGSAALKRIGEQKPDVIVLDVYMPGYSGLEVCQRLKEVGETAGIPILLTVGKLEPFKPEEVKRVRADGFIVKPFEASELLSALSKLEDRIVPRAETSKPGRFARAAALDQPYDKTVAIEEDTSWKNRIKFPSKKKSEEKDSDPEEAAVSNTVNKDLRTVIEHKIAETPSTGKADERVDLGALAPAGLPKDVTPEEIAALAAAAAQMQGKIADAKFAEAKISELSPESTSAQAAPVLQTEDSKHESPAVPDKAEAIATASTDSVVETKLQGNGDAKEAGVAAASSEPLSKEQVPIPTNGSSSTESADEPVTMAMGAPDGSEPPSSRWTAVAVMLAPEEAAISLEQEMQKAYAAFAAAESGHGATVSTSEQAESSVSAPPETAVPESVLSVPATLAPDAAQSLAAVASAATDMVSAAAEQLEAVAASFAARKDSAPTDPPASQEARSASAPVGEEPQPKPVIEEVSPEPIEAKKAEDQIQQPAAEERKTEESKEQAPEYAAPASVVSEASAEASLARDLPETQAESKPGVSEVPVQRDPDLASTTAAAWASWHRIRESSAQDAAVKAVAAGAENNPSDVSGETDSDPGIASIVDSVLADLRPKIVEEISKKLGKKK